VVLATDDGPADRALGGVVVEWDPRVVDETRESIPGAERVARSPLALACCDRAKRCCFGSRDVILLEAIAKQNKELAAYKGKKGDAQLTLKILEALQAEPPRLRRRPIVVSHAAWADSVMRTYSTSAIDWSATTRSR